MMLNRQSGGSGSELILPEERDTLSTSLQNTKCPVVPQSRDENLCAKWSGSTVSERFKVLTDCLVV